MIVRPCGCGRRGPHLRDCPKRHAGARRGHRPWTKADDDRLVAWYIARIGKPLELHLLAAEMGRTKALVSREARRLGLSDPRRPKPESAVAKASERMKRWHAEHEHPRGALGLKHAPETLAKMVEATRRAWANPASALWGPKARQARSDAGLRRVLARDIAPGFSRGKAGKRSDLGGVFFRSRWEANYARYLNLLRAAGRIAQWEYEPHVFVFEKIKRGTRAYTPDFRVTYPHGAVEWHEVKGWMDPKSRVRLARMAKYFPEEKIVLIDAAWFKSAARSGLPGVIAGWETQPNPRRCAGDRLEVRAEALA